MISCIIPTRDRCNLLKRAIDSVIDQDSDEIEIVVVDDGSIDNTFELV
ncbi:MAG: glycosyltransferase, partial [Desulfobacterales bacterium]|nr:glycosyltransferase [Desulfobacterales bacterium]